MIAWSAACATVWDDYADDVMQPAALSSLPSPSSSEPAELLLAETVVRYGEHEGRLVAREFTRTKTRIWGDAGQRYAVAERFVQGKLETLQAFEAAITGPSGFTRLGAADLSDVPSLGGYFLYSDVRELRLPVPVVAPGSVVEVASVVQEEEPLLFSARFTFGARIVTQRARFVVQVPAAWELEVRASPTLCRPPHLGAHGGTGLPAHRPGAVDR